MKLLDKIDCPFGGTCLYDTIVCHKTTCPTLAARTSFLIKQRAHFHAAAGAPFSQIFKVKSTRRRLVWYNLKKRAKTFGFSFVLIHVSMLARIFQENFGCSTIEIVG